MKDSVYWKDEEGVVHIKHPDWMTMAHCEIEKHTGLATHQFINHLIVKTVVAVPTCLMCLGQSL